MVLLTKVILLSILFCVVYSITKNNSDSVTLFSQTKPTTAIEMSPNLDHSFISQTLHCNNPNEYSLRKERDSEYNYVNIIQGNRVKHSIKLPTGLTLNGFALNSAKKTKAGFEISVEYGSRNYYEKRFNFICKQSRFYLNRVKTNSFDKNNPEKSNAKQIVITPNLPIEKFLFTNYITN